MVRQVQGAIAKYRINTSSSGYLKRPLPLYISFPFQPSYAQSDSILHPAYGSPSMNNAKLARFPRSKIWDKRTQQTVDRLRAFIHREPPPTVSDIQNESAKARPLKGPFCVTRHVLQAPAEDDVRQLLFEAITDLGHAEYEAPKMAHVPVEWIFNNSSVVVPGQQAGVTSLMEEEDYGLTILHVHGGAFL